jgi:hypothetical protein
MSKYKSNSIDDAPPSSIEMLDELIYDMRYKRVPIELSDLITLRTAMDTEHDFYAIMHMDSESLRVCITERKCAECGHIPECVGNT